MSDYEAFRKAQRELEERSVAALRQIDPSALQAVLDVLTEFMEWDEEGVKGLIEKALHPAAPSPTK